MHCDLTNGNLHFMITDSSAHKLGIITLMLHDWSQDPVLRRQLMVVVGISWRWCSSSPLLATTLVPAMRGASTWQLVALQCTPGLVAVAWRTPGPVRVDMIAPLVSGGGVASL